MVLGIGLDDAADFSDELLLHMAHLIAELLLAGSVEFHQLLFGVPELGVFFLFLLFFLFALDVIQGLVASFRAESFQLAPLGFNLV